MDSRTIPAISTEQMREVDRLMVAEYGIELIQMMENAGRNLADLAQQMLDDDVVDQSIVVLAGRGNNGGGGFVAARHLHNRGAWAQLVTTHAAHEYHGIAAQQLAILSAMEVPSTWADEGWELPPCDLVIDALIGYGLSGDPRGRARELILLANSSNAPILSLDAPSGVDTTTGELLQPHVMATATLTLALPKLGLFRAEAHAASGELYLADISVPPELYRRIGIDIGDFVFERPIYRVMRSADVSAAHIESFL